MLIFKNVLTEQSYKLALMSVTWNEIWRNELIAANEVSAAIIPFAVFKWV